MLAPIAAAMSRTKGGSNDAPQASGVGKIVADQAETGQALLMGNGRNAESARPHDLLLQLGQREHARRRRDRTGAEHPVSCPMPSWSSSSSGGTSALNSCCIGANPSSAAPTHTLPS
jgi:hypothetical protein